MRRPDMCSPYSNSDQTVVNAYIEACIAEHDYLRRVAASAQALGNNAGPLITRQVFTGTVQVSALKPLDRDQPPAGWKHIKKADQLVPRRGPDGLQANIWLTKWRAPAAARVREILAETGLPICDLIPGGQPGRRRIGAPDLYLFDDTVWALYRGRSGTWSDQIQPTGMWLARRLSEFHTAKETHEAACAAGKDVPGLRHTVNDMETIA